MPPGAIAQVAVIVGVTTPECALMIFCTTTAVPVGAVDVAVVVLTDAAAIDSVGVGSAGSGPRAAVVPVGGIVGLE